MLSKFSRLPANVFSEMYRRGKRYRGNALELIARPGKSTVSRFAFVVPASVDARATVRNRLRRVLSEHVRRLIDTLTVPYDVIVFVHPRATSLTPEQLIHALDDLVKLAHIRSGDQHS